MRVYSKMFQHVYWCLKRILEFKEPLKEREEVGMGTSSTQAWKQWKELCINELCEFIKIEPPVFPLVIQGKKSWKYLYLEQLFKYNNISASNNDMENGMLICRLFVDLGPIGKRAQAQSGQEGSSAKRATRAQAQSGQSFEPLNRNK